MTCQKCDKGRVPLGMVFYDKEIGFNTGGEGEFVEYEMGDCPCCNGKFESCQTCGGLTPLALDGAAAPKASGDTLSYNKYEVQK
jgi:hypothetical protein